MPTKTYTWRGQRAGLSYDVVNLDVRPVFRGPHKIEASGLVPSNGVVTAALARGHYELRLFGLKGNGQRLDDITPGRSAGDPQDENDFANRPIVTDGADGARELGDAGSGTDASDTELAAAIAALSGTYLPLQRRTYPELGGFLSQLRDDRRGCALTAVGDSTTSTVLTSLVDWLAPYIASRTVTRRTWSDTKQGYVTATTVQTGTLGDRYVTGNHNVSAAHSTASTVTGDLDVRIKVQMDDWTPASSLQTLAAKNGNAGNRSWWIDLNVGGNVAITLSADGTNFVTKTSIGTVSLVDGTPGWVRVTVDIDNGAGGYDVKMYQSTDGTTWTQLGATITTAGALSGLFPSTQYTQLQGRGGGTANTTTTRSYALRVLNGIDGPPVVDIDLDALPDSGSTFVDYAGNVCTVNTGATYTRAGALGLAVFDGSLSGSALSYASDATRFPKLTPHQADVIVINYGHTGGTATTAYLTEWEALLALFLAKWPYAFLLASIQNPQTTEGRTQAQVDAHATRQALIKASALSRQYGVIDAYTAFVNDGRTLLDILVDDGVHPTAAGYTLWLNAAKALFGPWI